jgi:hypothetical protein
MCLPRSRSTFLKIDLILEFLKNKIEEIELELKPKLQEEIDFLSELKVLTLGRFHYTLCRTFDLGVLREAELLLELFTEIRDNPRFTVKHD